MPPHRWLPPPPLLLPQHCLSRDCGGHSLCSYLDTGMGSQQTSELEHPALLASDSVQLR